MTKRVFKLVHAEARRRAQQAVSEAQEGAIVTIGPPTRSSDANAKMWAVLTDISKQVDWYGKKLSPTDWKAVFSSTLRKLEVVPNLDGTGFVALGTSTSTMSKSEMSELIELALAFGTEKGVKWGDFE